MSRFEINELLKLHTNYILSLNLNQFIRECDGILQYDEDIFKQENLNDLKDKYLKKYRSFINEIEPEIVSSWLYIERKLI